MIEVDRLIAPEPAESAEERFDRAIRPKSLEDYIGQQAVREQMDIFVNAARGRSDAEAKKIVGDARALDDAGAFAIVLEGVLEPIAIEATGAVSCPTIGIGASAQCDGQVLVTEDMLGMFDRVPRFVKKYEDIAAVIEKTVAQYAEEVRARSFPTPDQTYQPKG